MDHSSHHIHQHSNHEWIPPFSQLSFSDLWSPWLIFLLLIIIVLYFMITGPWRTKISSDAHITPGWRKSMFIIGIVLIYIASGSPLAALGHDYMFSAHMMQQSLMYLVVPAFILLGLPSWWFDRITNKKAARITIRIIQHPLFALFNFNIFFSLYHIPALFDAMSSNHYLHYGYHTWLQISAIQMWLLIITPWSGGDRLRPLQKIGYIFANGVLLTPACALIIFADRILYDTYVNAPVVIDLLAPIDDQQLGGVIMKLMQEAVYGLTLAIIFYRWYYSERRNDRVSPANQTF